ncbi:methyltransferase domain protein [mine drainage metagenome]|uniref:Methyltransferase domain protein n=1 Tax=mine drainage metagenome TaxID=410659 RepID=A0A1J5R0X6_9ZZZZ
MNPQHLFDEQQRWFNSTAGQYLRAKEQALYDRAVVDLFGFNALQMGCLQMDLLSNSRIPNRFISTEWYVPKMSCHMCCSDEFLPFAEQSLDVLLLPHRLEFSQRPHQTLREAERVLVHEGHLLISGFNPMSSWGVAAGLNRLFSNNRTYPWNGQFIGLLRMKDWLALMGFEIISVEMTCSVPPFEKVTWCNYFSFMDKFCAAMLGGVYFIVAKKRVTGLTPLKPNWKSAPLATHLIPRPSQKDVNLE